MFNLTFLNSGILFLTSAILIPLLIYLFAKRKPHKVVFSSIKFIKESQKKQKRRINIKNILLLIIRMLIILLTVLAISRPSLRAPFLSPGKKHPPTAVVMIIDNSYSMDYLVDTQTDLEKGKEIATRINSLLSENDVTSVLTLDKAWNEVNSVLHYGRIPIDIINNIRITSTASELTEIYETAQEKLSESQLVNQEIYYITDGQDYELPEKIQAPTFVIETSADSLKYNLSCEDVRISKSLIGRELKQKVIFKIVNHSSANEEDVIQELNLNGITIAEQVSDLKPYQSKQLDFEINLEKSGWQSGYVEVRNERLTHDNRNYFSFYYDLDPKIAVITGIGEIPLTLQTILEVYTAKSENIEVMNDPNRIDLDELIEYDNIIILGNIELNNRMRFVLDQLSQKEVGILFIITADMNEELKSYLQETFTLEFEEYFSDSEGANLTYLNQYHPVTSLLSANKDLVLTDFWKVKTNRDILLQVEDYPIALESSGNIVWLFNPGSLKNPFLVDAAFPVFAYNCLQFLSSGSNLSFSEQVGKVVRGKGKSLTLPSGEQLELGDRNLILKEPGIYKIGTELLAINLDYSESRFSEMNKQDRRNLYFTSDSWEDDILQSRYGIEIWKYLLLTVLILFVFEMILIKKEENK